MPVLPDLLMPGLKLVICGTAAGRRSAEVGAYYAGPGNQFWGMLNRVGITPRILAPAEFPKLAGFGVGLTDVVKDAFGADSEIARHHFAAASALRDRIVAVRPGVLAFNGKRSATAYFGRTLQYGYQAGQDLGDTRIYVAPSTSGAARGFWNEEIWREIARAAGFVQGSTTERIAASTESGR
jgi:TDG/mug DNA glycosylase family protein